MKRLRTTFPSLKLHGPDQKGILAACSHALDKFGCSIVHSETWTDRYEHLFFQRILFNHDNNNDTYENDLMKNKRSIINNINRGDFVKYAPSTSSGEEDSNKVLIHPERIMEINHEMEHLRRQFGLSSMNIDWRTKPKKVAVFVSKYDHCLWEILLRHQAKELDCDIKVVISNHPTLKPIADTFGIPFKCYPISPENKYDQERKEIALLKQELDVDVLVLARYMQVLSNDFLNSFSHDQIINIHHSFLPAFIGRSPYHQAHERGVKLIGATAHYVTEDLDDGPIITQDVIHVTHRDDPSDLIRKGRIVERNVLVDALRAHLEDRIISYKNKCVVFSE